MVRDALHAAREEHAVEQVSGRAGDRVLEPRVMIGTPPASPRREVARVMTKSAAAPGDVSRLEGLAGMDQRTDHPSTPSSVSRLLTTPRETAVFSRWRAAGGAVPSFGP